MSRDKLIKALLVERFGPLRRLAREANADPPKAIAARRRDLDEALRRAPAGDASDASDGDFRPRPVDKAKSVSQPAHAGSLLGEED